MRILYVCTLCVYWHIHPFVSRAFPMHAHTHTYVRVHEASINTRTRLSIT